MDSRRDLAVRRLYDDKWRKYRLMFLAQNPLCSDPFGEHGKRIVPAAVVDHARPHRGDVGLFWDEANHRALCKRCHDRKTAMEDGGFGNRRSQSVDSVAR